MVAFIEKDYEIPDVAPSDFGREWPRGPRGEETDQVVKDLVGFRSDGKGGFLSRYEHGLRLIQMLWPKKVALWKDVSGVRVYNNFFLDIFKACCEEDRVGLTGCASSGKTFAVAAYAILAWMSDPGNTTIMVSTTAGTDAERRIWGEIKDLYSSIHDRFPVGVLVDYLKAIVFEPGREIQGKGQITDRDLRNCISVIPIPRGSEGEKALGKIIGTKNRNVIWIIDEMPHMIDDILRPESNLEANIRYQFIGIGNANRKNDPHGKLCEPDGGWSKIDPSMESWRAGDCAVLFMHGERSPNFHPAVPKDCKKEDLPFPYLSNRIFIEKIAYRNGYGETREERIDSGRQTIDYWRFGVGYWYGDMVSTTIMSEQLIRQCGADSPEFHRTYHRTTKVAGFDPAFSSGGDSIELCVGEFGLDADGNQILLFPPETRTYRVTISDNEEFRREVSRRVVEDCIKEGIEPSSFGMDISGDGGLFAIEIQKAWGDALLRNVAIHGISSKEHDKDEKDKYFDKVTKLWFETAKAIKTGRVRGFNIESGYAKDLFERQYESVGNGAVRIEPKGATKTAANKKGMKSRIGRSPDKGDAACYMVHMAIKKGFKLKVERLEPRRVDPAIRRRWGAQSTEDGGHGHGPGYADSYAGAGRYGDY